jgi:type II secretory pathway pseudopilin PulG
MISSTGKQKKNKNTGPAASQAAGKDRVARLLSLPDNISGMTLVELMLVAAIILALVTISTPLFRRTYEDLKLSSSARGIANLIQFCQESSIMERKRFRLEIDRDKKSYRILVEDEEKREFSPLGSRWGRTFKIPADIEIETEIEELDFYPNGRVTPGLVYLTNKAGKSYTLSIEQNTGLVSVYDYKKEE